MSKKLSLKEIEAIALDKVMDYERSQNRDPIREQKRGNGYDIRSGDRKIEVKGTTLTWHQNKSSYQYVSENERRKATHLYLVCDVKNNADLHIFEMNKIHHALIPETRYMCYFSKCRDMESDETKNP